MLTVTGAHRLGQCDQRGTVVDGIHGTKDFSVESKDIALKNIQTGGPVMHQLTDLTPLGDHAQLIEQLIHRNLAQFGARNAVALRQQPGDIPALTAQGQKYTAALRQGQC